MDEVPINLRNQSENMRKTEYINNLWENQKEWDYNVRLASVFKDLIQDSTPILRAMKKSAYQIEKMDNIKNKINTEIEAEDETEIYSFAEALKDASSIAKFSVNGKNTRAYYYDKEKGNTHYEPKTNKYLILTIFRKELWNENSNVLNGSDYKDIIRFIEAGCMNMRTKR